MYHQHPLHQAPTDMMQLQRWMNAHTTSQALAMRARIVVTAHSHPTWTSRTLAQSLGVSDRLVRKWRRRWQETHSLTDLPRSGAPRRFSSEVRAQMTALACSLPRSHGVPLAHWSRAELARHVATVPTLPTISARTIGRWLTAEQIRPWRFHSWQHIQEPKTLLQRGIWVVCTDEKTSIQARQAEQAPRPAVPKHPVYQSPRYTRHGALHLMAAWSVADGLVYGQCHPRKRFVDFRSFLETVIVAEA